MARANEMRRHQPANRLHFNSRRQFRLHDDWQLHLHCDDSHLLLHLLLLLGPCLLSEMQSEHNQYKHINQQPAAAVRQVIVRPSPVLAVRSPLLASPPPSFRLTVRRAG